MTTSVHYIDLWEDLRVHNTQYPTFWGHVVDLWLSTGILFLVLVTDITDTRYTYNLFWLQLLCRVLLLDSYYYSIIYVHACSCIILHDWQTQEQFVVRAKIYSYHNLQVACMLLLVYTPAIPILNVANISLFCQLQLVYFLFANKLNYDLTH